MGVYIKGMEMPTSPVLFCIHPDGKVFADLEGNWREYKAVPVPPHGDLIDKKTVSENLASVLNKKNPPFSYPDWNDAIIAMLTAPTIVPADGKDICVLTREGGARHE